MNVHNIDHILKTLLTLDALLKSSTIVLDYPKNIWFGHPISNTNQNHIKFAY